MMYVNSPAIGYSLACGCPFIQAYIFVGTVSLFLVLLISDVALVICSGRGSVFDTKARAPVATILYIRLGVYCYTYD